MDIGDTCTVKEELMKDPRDMNYCEIHGTYHNCGYAGDGTFFADPTGRSALRAESAHNPRNLPCPTCGTPNVLTPADRARGYQCDACADQAEWGY